MKPDNVIDLGPAKKQSVRPADPVLIQPAPTPAPNSTEDVFKPYPDGVLFKCSAKPGGSGQFLIHDDGGAGCIALVKNQTIANLFCAALHVYFQAAQQNATEQLAEQNGAMPGVPMPAEVAVALENSTPNKS